MTRLPATLLAAATTVVLLAGPAAADPAEVELEVAPRQGAVGDVFKVTFTVRIEGVSGVDQIWPPEMDDFKVVDRQVASTRSMQYDAQRGNVITTTEIHSYSVQARSAGRFYIGPGKVRAGGKESSTRVIGVTVGAAGAGAGAGAGSASADPDPTAAGGVGAPGFHRPEVSGTPDQFLHVVVDRLDPYVGEQVVATWLLYVREELLKFEPTPLRLDDFWSEKIYEPTRHLPRHVDDVNGTRYRVSIVSKRALFPTRAGQVEIGPFRGKVQTNYSRLGALATVESKPVTLEVKELPPGAPPGFDPTYVGNFEARASVDRTQIDAGGSLTMTLEIFGTGALRRTTPPELRAGGFEFRAPRDFDETVDVTGPLVGGKRTYRYWTTPQQGGAQTIPPLKIAYFDPVAAEYRLAQTEPIALVVRGSPGDDDASSENFIAPDIRLIRDGTTIASVTMPRAYQSLWYWLLVALPILGFVGVSVAGFVRRGMEKDTDRSRVRRARGRARKRFKLADVHLRGNRPSRLFGELAGAIYGHLEERVGHPLQALTRDELERELRERGFADELVERVEAELSNCDFARFTPAASGPGEMKAALTRTRELLRDIERAPLTGGAEEGPA